MCLKALGHCEYDKTEYDFNRQKDKLILVMQIFILKVQYRRNDDYVYKGFTTMFQLSSIVTDFGSCQKHRISERNYKFPPMMSALAL